MREKWTKVQDVFLLDSSLDWSTVDEDALPAKLIIGLIKQTDRLRVTLDGRTQQCVSIETNFKKEKEKLQVDLAKANDQLKDVTYYFNKTKSEVATLKSTVEHLQQLNRDKLDEIGQLKKDSTVQLWDKEKKKLLEKTAEKEEELKALIEKLQKEKVNLMEKIKDLSNQNKMEKLKNELHMRPSADDMSGEVEKYKRHIFILEQDLRRMDTEMNNQQKYVIGMFGGISEDVNKLVDKIPENTCLDITETTHVIRTLRQLAIRAMKILKGAREGKLGMLRADLPDHYLSTAEVVGSPLKKLSTAYGARSVSPHSSKTPRQENGAGAITSEFGGKMSDRLSTLRESDKLLQDTVQEHPELVNPVTGYVNMIRVMKYFPHMTQSYVKEQWEMFHQYDTNKDGTLDLPEMMLAMTSTLGQKFTATQVKEAMTEVDVDRSNSIDFFEYLSVADMLKNKKGRSELFRSSLIQQQGRHVSKTCAVM
ncbi:hypothetical protein NP493_1561g00003 [Ridgeia piscesae]|uniref:EF-hand domain-containing protein n=1 Tax=Ridgeia piscesae TaxID=27915 RepID=A0AAD9JYX8_RIDPI|nr:hypothetical protein NP493_1561g00003 [Ridgeia piscesae]